MLWIYNFTAASLPEYFFHFHWATNADCQVLVISLFSEPKLTYCHQHILSDLTSSRRCTPAARTGARRRTSTHSKTDARHLEHMVVLVHRNASSVAPALFDLLPFRYLEFWILKPLWFGALKLEYNSDLICASVVLCTVVYFFFRAISGGSPPTINLKCS